jgi:Flp pilus assembly protein protease CpaA
MLLIVACLLSLAVVFGLRERRTPDASRVGAGMGLQGAGHEVLVAVPLFALAAYGAGNGTLLATVGGFMGFDAPSSLRLTAGIRGGILAMVYVWCRGSMIPALLQGREVAGATAGRAMGMELP